MKIVFIQNDLPPDHFGGSEILTLKLARKFSDRGVHVTILTRRLQYWKTTNKVRGITIRKIGIPFKKNNRSLLHRFVWFVSFILSGCIQCIKLKPDVIHSHTRIPGGIISGMAVILTPAASFLSIHSNLEILGFFERIMTLLVLRINPNIIVPTKFSEKQVNSLCSSKVFIVPNAASFSDGKVRREELNNNIVFTGRLHPIKGLEFAIKALKIVKDRQIPFQFNIVGNGREKFRLMKLVQDLNLGNDVIFLGQVSEKKKDVAYRNASYFLLPSLSECFPISILEAINSGLYIIASQVGGVPEMLDYGKHGKLVPSKDVLAIANTIESLFNQEDSEKLEIIKQAFHVAKLKYNLDVVTKHYLNYYFSSLHRRSPPSDRG